MIREINVSEITAAIKEMCIQANHFLSPDMDKALKAAPRCAGRCAVRPAR